MQLQDTSAPPPGSALPIWAAVELQDHLLVAGNDLDRLQRLLSDASEALMAHFYGANQALQPLLRDGANDAGDGAAHAGSATAASHPQALQQALAHLAGAITAMQFQDMASQLVAHTGQRLRSCADRIARDTFADDEDEAVVEAPPLRPNPVTQDEMDAGSVELF